LRASTRNWVPPTRAITSLFRKAAERGAGHGLQRRIAGPMPEAGVQLRDIVHIGEEDLDVGAPMV
jgi:hypothetical protein